MTSSSHSLAHDLALKRTVHAPVDQKPHYAWRDVVAAESITVPPVVLLCPHGEEKFVLAEVADTLGKALTNVALAKGEKDIFNDTNRAWVARICREVTANLTELARNQNPLRLSLNALYELIEKTLVDNNAYFVAKSLLLNRARKISVDRESAAQSTLRVIRRNNQVVPWSEQKVEIAVRKTFLSLQRDSAPAVAITKAVSERVHASKQAFVHIEEVQDMVQEELMKGGFFKVAEAYILFRADRSAARLAGHTDEPSAAAPASPAQETMIVVKKANGENIFWDGADLRKRIEFARIGLDLCLSNEEIEQELRRAAYDQILQKDLDATIILNSKTLIEKDADFAKFAGRIQLTYIYEEVLGWDIMRDGIGALKAAHQRAFKKYLEHGVAIKRLNPRLLDFDLTKLAAALDPSSDLEFDFLGIQTLYDRYLIIDKTKKPAKRLETPQFFWIRVAMGLSLDEPTDREGKAAGLYSLYKTRRFCSSTPTLFNAGTLHSQLSSCYLYYVDDSIEGIFQRGISENAYLSKWAGGLGGSWTAVRGTGAYIGGTNGESQGVIPFLKLHNDQLVAVNQGGKRKGSGCAYLETWHNDIFEFLELRKNTGDDRRRTHDMNTANWIPDLFMRRVMEGGEWTLFSPSTCPDLHDKVGQAFEQAYLGYEARAAAGEQSGHGERQKHGVASGIHVADAAQAQRRAQEGFQFIAVASDAGFLMAKAKARGRLQRSSRRGINPGSNRARKVSSLGKMGKVRGWAKGRANRRRRRMGSNLVKASSRVRDNSLAKGRIKDVGRAGGRHRRRRQIPTWDLASREIVIRTMTAGVRRLMGGLCLKRCSLTTARSSLTAGSLPAAATSNGATGCAMWRSFSTTLNCAMKRRRCRIARARCALNSNGAMRHRRSPT